MLTEIIAFILGWIYIRPAHKELLPTKEWDCYPNCQIILQEILSIMFVGVHFFHFYNAAYNMISDCSVSGSWNVKTSIRETCWFFIDTAADYDNALSLCQQQTYSNARLAVISDYDLVEVLLAISEQ